MHEEPEAERDAAGPVTELLVAWQEGDGEALDRLIPLVYRELHRLAAGHLRRERGGHTLDTSALVHEAYLRLVDQNRAQWRSRVQFFGVAGRMMRRVLVDHARRRRAARRGGGLRITLGEDAAPGGERSLELLAVDQLLDRLEILDPRQVRIVELRFFAGLTIPETAAALRVSPATVKREWTVARAWLRRELCRETADES